MFKSRVLGVGMGAVLVLALAGCGEETAAEDVFESAAPQALPAEEGSEQFLDNQELSILDQRVTYPKKKPARISSETVVLESGESTGWRRHRIPVYVHVLSGTYTVDFGEGALVEYPAGSAFMQATKTDYNGINTGDEQATVLHVYLGAKGLRDVIER
jgi:quercetin dioxygenase-like cupin family protein